MRTHGQAGSTRKRSDPPGVPNDRKDNHSARTGVEARAHHRRWPQPRPHSAYPTFAMVKWVPVPQVDTMRLGWTRVGVLPVSRRQPLTCADVRSGLLSRGRAGRIRTGDPLTPRKVRHAPPAKTATTEPENLLPSLGFRSIRPVLVPTMSPTCPHWSPASPQVN
jgi:hypothetical protein